MPAAATKKTARSSTSKKPTQKALVLPERDYGWADKPFERSPLNKNIGYGVAIFLAATLFALFVAIGTRNPQALVFSLTFFLIAFVVAVGYLLYPTMFKDLKRQSEQHSLADNWVKSEFIPWLERNGAQVSYFDAHMLLDGRTVKVANFKKGTTYYSGNLVLDNRDAIDAAVEGREYSGDAPKLVLGDPQKSVVSG